MGIKPVNKTHPFFLDVAFLQNLLELIFGQGINQSMMVGEGAVTPR
jgi:hypothetical protein